MDELQARFERFSGGRNVLVRFEPRDFILVLDYKITYGPELNAFDVILRRGGCFEGAYRCIERWIEAKAEQLDGINGVPVGYADLRSEMQYWALEKIYEQFRSDLESAIGDKVSCLKRVRPGEAVVGEVVVEARERSLGGLLALLDRVDAEVRRGVLSPLAIELWKNIGLEVFARPATPPLPPTSGSDVPT